MEKEFDILVVEDDKFFRDLLERKFGREGLAVATALSGEDALQRLAEHRPRLVVLDMNLPGLSGLDILERMHADETLAYIPVLVLSNINEDETKRRAADLGAKGYLIKAYTTLDEIVSAARKILQENY